MNKMIYGIRWGQSEASRCPITGEIVDTAAGWAVFERSTDMGAWGAKLSRTGAEQVSPELATILSLIPADARPVPAEFSLCIAEPWPSATNTKCPETGQPFHARPLDIVANNGARYSVEGSRRVAPTLSAAIHKHLGTTPTPKPAPIPEPLATPADLERRRTGNKRRQAIRQAARAIAPLGFDDEYMGRAADLLEAVRNYLATHEPRKAKRASRVLGA